MEKLKKLSENKPLRNVYTPTRIKHTEIKL